MTTPWENYELHIPDPGKSTDLDETRRLLYMALAVYRSPKRYALVGTLINALAHHNAGIDPDEVMEHVLNVVEYAGPAATTPVGIEFPRDEAARESRDWIREQIAKITELRGDGASA